MAAHQYQAMAPMIPKLTSPPVITSLDLPPILATNPALGHPLVTSLLTSNSDTGLEPYLDVLKHLPPTLPSFDLIGRLLRDSTAVTDMTTGGKTTIADLVRTEVLGWFIHECVMWLDRAEQDEREGNISDDRFAKGVQNVRIDPCSCVALSPLKCFCHLAGCTDLNLLSSVVSITHSSSCPSSTPRPMRIQPRWRTSPCATRASRRRTRCTALSPWASSDQARPPQALGLTSDLTSVRMLVCIL